MLAEHRGLAILFVAIAIGFAAYGWRALRAPALRPTATAAPPTATGSPPTGALPGQSASAAASSAASRPIYIEALPDDKSP